MFKKTTLLSTLIVGVVCGGWLLKLLFITSHDRVRYEKIRDQGKAIAQAAQAKESRQKRSGVQKDLWLAQEDHTRLHHRIASESSVLTLMPVNDRVDIVEQLQHFQCWMQDKIYSQHGAPLQQIRFFEAQEGIYQHSLQKFTANRVALSLFRLPGSQLPTTFDQKRPFLQGIAQDVSFAIAGKATQFQAQQFKATVTSQQGEKP